MEADTAIIHGLIHTRQTLLRFTAKMAPITDASAPTNTIQIPHRIRMVATEAGIHQIALIIHTVPATLTRTSNTMLLPSHRREAKKTAEQAKTQQPLSAALFT